MTVLERGREGLERMDGQLGRVQFLTGNALKTIAVLSMLVDHVTKIVLQWVLNNHWWQMYQAGQMSDGKWDRIDTFVRFGLLKDIGSIAFPLFCFLLVEGFLHTRNRKRYMGMMLVFALISEIPFDMGFFSEWAKRAGTFPFYWSYQNVFFTLFLGLAALTCLERFSCNSGKRGEKLKSLVLQILSVAAIAALADGIRCDYESMGILFIAAFYVARKSRVGQVLLYIPVFALATGEQPHLWTLVPCLLILLYNGKRGKGKLKYLFYWFYPAHIGVLYLITVALEKFWL